MQLQTRMVVYKKFVERFDDIIKSYSLSVAEIQSKVENLVLLFKDLDLIILDEIIQLKSP